MTTDSDAPLSGIVVLDVARLLPGAVLARMLLDLGARLIKIEDPIMGDPFRHAPPQVAGTSAGFATFLRGAESMSLDLRQPEGAARLRKLVGHADVLIESFRPGTMKRWELGPDEIRGINPALVYCSLSGMGQGDDVANLVAHDLNLTASSGLLSLLPLAQGIPRIQIADINTGVLGCTAILAALLKRGRTGQGSVLDQPLAAGVLPLLTWIMADSSVGGVGMNDHILAGDCPCYRTYPCSDGTVLAAGTLEPKFWAGFCDVIGLPHLASVGLDSGDAGASAIEEVKAVLATKPSDHWVALAIERGLPVSPVDSLDIARGPGRFFASTGLSEETPTADGASFETTAPYIPSLGRTPTTPAPRLGEHTEAILHEFDLE